MAGKLEPEEKQSISTFKKKSNEFFNLWDSLTAKKKYISRLPNDVKQEYLDLLDRGKFINDKIKWIDGLINQASAAYRNVKAWLSRTFGLGDYEQLKNYNYQQLQGLGIIPLIPVAIIAGAVSFMGYWVNDAFQFNAKLNEIMRLEKKGLSPSKASEIVRKTFNKKGFFSGLNKIILPLALGAGVLIYLKVKK